MNKKKIFRPYSKPTKVSHVLRQALKNHNLEDKILKYEFVKNWSEIVGPELAQICTPTGIKGTKLFVEVPSSVWVQELSFQKKIILGRLQEYIEEDLVVEDLQFVPSK